MGSEHVVQEVQDVNTPSTAPYENNHVVLILFLIIKITISSIVIGLKTPISHNSLAKLLSDRLLLDSLLSDSSINQSH